MKIAVAGARPESHRALGRTGGYQIFSLPEARRGDGSLTATIRVLKLGDDWNRLDQAVASLSVRGIAEFVEPVGQEIQEAVSRTSPSAIMVSPGADQIGRSFLDSSDSDQAALPPVLLCVDHESLETEELYGYADDFLLIPCSAAEMEKRLRRLVQGKPAELPHYLLRLDEITLNTQIYEVRIEGKRVELAWMEFQLLKFLMENSGRIFTRDELLAGVWSIDNFGGTRTVDVHIRRLRQKLGLLGSAYIRTVANVGYGLVDP